MRVPPELDSLMWAIAEEDSPRAADEFVRRYPGYRDEFLRRRNAVSHLKSGRPTPLRETLKPIPRFTPRAPRPVGPERRSWAVASVLALAALAAAAYTVTSLLYPHRDPVIVEAPAHPVVTPVPRPAVPEPPEEKLPPVVENDPRPRKPVVSPADQTQTFAAAHMTLTRALRALEQQAGLTFVLAPGMPDPYVDVRYDRESVMTILRDLGHQFRFTAFDQGDGTVLIIPAVDPHEAASGRIPPVRRIGG